LARTARSVLVIGSCTPANLSLVEKLRLQELEVIVAPEREAFRLLAQGETPDAVLLLGDDAPGHAEGCIDRIRSHRGLTWVPVMLYSTEDRRDPPPDELAALIAAAAATSDAPRTARAR
jgi:hypothetical protein